MDTPRNQQPSPENIRDADELADYIMKVQGFVILSLSPELNKGNVSFAQFLLLTYLTTEESLGMGDIAKKMGHSTAASTGMIDRLEKIKLVEREYWQEDRRKIMVHITQKGVEFVAKMRSEISKGLRDMLAE